ncbi:MAG TPA: hypothetical protein VED40_01610 [Azospirillaceae bacterium]|nr:hypothetical protein [Azospirillaceae bacterium]
MPYASAVPLSLEERLAHIDRLAGSVATAMDGVLTPGTPVLMLDLLVVGALNRTVAQIAGFAQLVRARNFLCAASLLRPQLDTAIRLFGISLTDDQEAYARLVLAGEKITGFKDRKGRRLNDGYLAERLSEHFRWVKPVYDASSGFIHLSSRHVQQAIVQETGAATQLRIAPIDSFTDETPYYELVDAFMAATRAVLEIVQAYAATRGGAPVAPPS